MKTKLLFSTILGVAAWSLSHVAVAGWVDGPCPQPHIGPAPCIEAVYHNGSTDPNDWDYHHFNGDGSQADRWKGAPRGGDFQFSGESDLECGILGADCTLTLGGKVKKCQDSDGNWRIGVQVNSYNIDGPLLCGAITLGGFPWYAKDASITPHCPFDDNCDTFIPYVPGAPTLTGNIGNIDINLLGMPRVTNGHVHSVIFTPGTPGTSNTASFSFASNFFNCSEGDQGCSVNGELILNNASELNIY